MAIKVMFHAVSSERFCADGWGAAYAAWRHFGDQAEYLPCVHGEPVPEVLAGDEVYVLDFSFPRAVLLEWSGRASVRVIDHHISAQRDLEGLGAANLCVRFDMNKSGSVLAWEHFFPHLPVPELLLYVQDRDLWRHELRCSREIQHAIGRFPQTFQVWDWLAKMPDFAATMCMIGTPLHQKYQSDVQELVETAQWVRFDGTVVLGIETTKYGLVSDALNQICKLNPQTAFALNQSPVLQGDQSKVKIELRSIGNFDVSAVARKLGGGGHKNAAGCIVKLDQAPVPHLPPSQ